MADWKTVTVDPNGGDVTAVVDVPHDPQLIYGKIWRYTSDKARDGTVGWYSTIRKETNLGSVASVRTKRFVIVGVVVAHGDDPPSPYTVEVRLEQDGKVIHGPLTPGDGGQGAVGDREKAFTYHLHVQ